MTGGGSYITSINRCKPVGAVGDEASAISLAIRKRLDTSPRGTEQHLTVFAVDGCFYATRASSPISHTLKSSQIVGVYTHVAAAIDIAADLEAWRTAA